MKSLEIRLKNAVLDVKLDNILRGIARSPERCARNLVDLGKSVSPKELTRIEYRLLYDEFLRLGISSDIEGTKRNFFRHFTPD